jgi:cyclic pyranopterin phosphate synthase
VRRDLAARWTLTASEARSGGPARYVDIAETGGRLGFITPLTGNFCDGCNRVRVTATGQLFMCLGGEGKVDLRAALRSDDPDAALAVAMARAWAKSRTPRLRDRSPRRAARASRHMSMTGG